MAVAFREEPMHADEDRRSGVESGSAGGTAGRRPLRGLRVPGRTTIEWGVAALAAAALLFVAWVVLRYWWGAPRGIHESLLGGGLLLALVCIYAHVRLDRNRRSALWISVAVAVLNVVASVGVAVLVLIGGSCDDNGHIPTWAWPVAALLYLVGATVGLRKRWHAVWAVPLSLLAAGGWLVFVGTALTRSTGARLD